MNDPFTNSLIPGGQPGKPLTMSSREIADLLEVRHDSVKRTVERLVEKGVIEVPPLVEDQIETSHGRKHAAQVYRLKKRDSYVVVAQLSPEFTARVVDRWQELEEQNAGFTLPKSFGEALRLAADQAETIEAMRPDFEAHARLVKAEGSVSITEAAKNLSIPPQVLFKWLAQNGWIYKRAGAAAWLGYATKTNAGYLQHKTTTVLRGDGTEKITEQVRVTALGLSRLAKLVPGADLDKSAG